MVLLGERATGKRSELARLREENRNLLAENQRLQEQLTHLLALQEVALGLAAELDFERLLEVIVRSAPSVSGGSTVSVLMLDPPTEDLVFEVVLGERTHPLRGQRLRLGEGIAGWVAARGRPLIVNDVGGDSRCAQEFGRMAGFPVRCVLAVPLKAKGRTIGVLEALNKSDGRFTRQDLSWFLALASQAAIGLENVRLYQKLAEERDRLINLQEETRKHLARDLHDGPAQALSALTMNVDYLRKLLERDPQKAVEELDNFKALALKTSRELRTLLFELRPLILESQGLLPTLQSYVGQLQSQPGPKMQLHIKGDLRWLDQAGVPGSLGQTTGIAIFTILQEALGNVKKHAQARHCRIDLFQRGGYLHVVVADDGVGFDLPAVMRDYDQRVSFGLLNMRERAELLGGSLSVKSAPGEGTTVTLKVPIGTAGGNGT